MAVATPVPTSASMATAQTPPTNPLLSFGLTANKMPPTRMRLATTMNTIGPASLLRYSMMRENE
jgi:hypothetical protein